MGKHKTKICPACNRERPTFTVRKKGCDKCRPEVKRKAQHEAPNKVVMADIRAKRNKLLTQCDWTQLEDVPKATKQAWQKYRRALRDITKTKDLAKIQWPSPPE